MNMFQFCRTNYIGFKSFDIIWNVDGEGIYPLITDIEVRKYGDQMGLGTPVVHTVNDEC